MRPNKLTEDQLLEVISLAPLVSIDLIIRDSESRVLMGRRNNMPTAGKWFVPGGRIYKCEELDDAFKEICKAEVGQELLRKDATFIGLYTHKYPDNFMGVEGIGTHYVVLAYELRLTKPFSLKSTDHQHSEFAWFAPHDPDPDIHDYARKYLNHPLRMDEGQYAALNARRDSFNSLVWQTPVLSLTAQAFLFATILSADASILARRVASTLALFVALASLQLFAKHRFMENSHAEILKIHERTYGRFNANQQLASENWVFKIRSHWIWQVLLGVFALVAGFALVFPEVL